MAARDFLQDDHTARPAILTLVVAVHLAVLLIPWEERVRASDTTARGTLLLIPERNSILPDESRAPSVKLSAVNVDSPSPPSLAPMYVPTETSTGSAMALPDWKQSGAEAAADAARDNYRALGPRPEDPQVKLPASPFRPPPRHKHGETGIDELRNPILWLSENCWLRPRNFAAQPGDPFATVPMTFCSFPFGKKEPRGDLLEHLRKTPPVP